MPSEKRDTFLCMDDLEGQKIPTNREERLEALVDLGRKRQDVAGLGYRLNKAMIQKLLPKQEIAADSERVSAEEAVAKYQSVTAGLGIPEATPKDSEIWLARTWGLKMRCLRHILGLTQEQLAEGLRTSRNTIINYEKPSYEGKASRSIALAFDIYIENMQNNTRIRRGIESMPKSLE